MRHFHVQSHARLERSNTRSAAAHADAADLERELPPVNPVLRATVKYLRRIPPLPPAVRKRALARARAMLAAQRR
jgi:hypothetical protein